MSVNGITAANNIATAYTSYENTAKNKTTENAATTTQESGAVYEKSDTAAAASTQKKTYTSNTDVVSKMKADLEQRQQQLTDLVQQMLGKQSKTYGDANNIWQFLAKGSYTVDPQTQAQAQADISEDGYWGVSQTSSRILDFASALTGGDPSKIEKMRDAFKKGYAQAEDTWGDKLPDISQKTYQAVMDGFDKLAKDAGLPVQSSNSESVST
ncbi:MAG: hypothetical protein KA965_09070 [Butyrivibrio sp.]|nr:hypothetical protein [Butyrivibrio sp.]